MSHPRHGRSKPYTPRGVRRLPCYICGTKATDQLRDGPLWRPVCSQHQTTMATPTVLSHVLVTGDGGRYPFTQDAVVIADAVQVEFDRKDAKSTACTLVGPSPMATRHEHKPKLTALGEKPFPVKPGKYTLTLTSFTEDMGKGEKGPDYVVRFEVVAPVKPPVAGGGAPRPDPRVKELEDELAAVKTQLAEPWSFDITAPEGFACDVSKLTFTRVAK